jgi:predicted secreted protein
MDAQIAHGLHYVVLFSAYAVLWFLCFFCLLPIGLGEVDPLTGAPLRARLGRKALWACGIALVLWAVFYGLVGFGWLEV